MRAMLLAAGFGTRLRPLTELMPKPLAPVANRPVMGHLLDLLSKHGFTEVVANLSYLPDAIRERFGDGSDWGVSLTYTTEDHPLGTAGGVANARDFLCAEADCFLVISGDALTDVDLTALVEGHRVSGGLATLATKTVADPSEFGVVICDRGGRIQGFQEKPPPGEELSNLANCGIYVFSPEIFDYFPPADHRSPAGGDDQPSGFVDWAMDVFPALLEADVPFHAHPVAGYWNDIGSIAELVAGNADALEGRVAVDLPGEEVAPGIRVEGGGGLPSDADVSAPAVIGAGCRLSPGAVIRGPVALGDGVSVGEAARVRGSVLLPGARVPSEAVLVGGVFGEYSATD